jgi:hypothetical protein
LPAVKFQPGMNGMDTGRLRYSRMGLPYKWMFRVIKS